MLVFVLMQVIRDGGSIGDVTVFWSLLDDSSDDFVYDSGQIEIEEGRTETTLTITVRPDDEPELDEVFTVLLTNVSQVCICIDGPYGVLTRSESILLADTTWGVVTPHQRILQQIAVKLIYNWCDNFNLLSIL